MSGQSRAHQDQANPFPFGAPSKVRDETAAVLIRYFAQGRDLFGVEHINAALDGALDAVRAFTLALHPDKQTAYALFQQRADDLAAEIANDRVSHPAPREVPPPSNTSTGKD